MVCHVCDEPIPQDEMAKHLKIHIKQMGKKRIKQIVREKLWQNKKSN
jgi:hypothetical protein